MKLAYVMSEARGQTDLALHETALMLQARGLRLAGLVQTNVDCPGTHHCDMDVQILPDGPELRISQKLGAASLGCRLDPSVLEQAVAIVAERMATPPDLLLINKFGKHEAEGRGFREVMAEALAADIPVIVGVNALNFEAFLTYSDGAAIALSPDPAAIAAWAETSLAFAV